LVPSDSKEREPLFAIKELVFDFEESVFDFEELRFGLARSPLDIHPAHNIM
jgi:hypothetical protein